MYKAKQYSMDYILHVENDTDIELFKNLRTNILENKDSLISIVKW